MQPRHATGVPAMRMLKFGLSLLLATVALAGCAATKIDRNSALDKVQYAYSAAIRWGDFEGAWNLVDPDYKKLHPMSNLEFERYKQIQISSYRDLAAQVGESTAMREIQIGVINRNTLVERETRYTERWRYDAEHKTWWLTAGLPNLWEGQ
jgi:hypothetical protein